MDVSLDHHAPPRAEDHDSGAMERRLFSIMCWTVALTTLASLAFAPWRVTTGLALGGALALLNHHWLRTSIRAAFTSASITGLRPKLSVARFILRYFVVTASIIAAYEFGIVSIVATLVGLSAFVVAGVAEGFIQTFLIFVHREEN
jgi:hypothetical protein